jgi:hypothetical protein
LFLLLWSGVLGAPLEARYRFGVGVAQGSIEDYDVEQLRAGWYVNWHTTMNPSTSAGMEYVQMVRLHQLTACWPQQTRDREECPYVEPYTYTLWSPGTKSHPGNLSDVALVAQVNPGSLWLIGNEMDRRDWEGGGQDEMLPQLYAQAYHELYHVIKDADPAASVAIGGVVQPTPFRLEYLDEVLDEYQARYGAMIPVDVWNIHNMILREGIYQYGADIPPGNDAYWGMLYTFDDADDIEVFKQQIRDFRQWMKDKGERDKPLIISEYSVLYGESQGFDYQRVKDYLYATFDFLTTATDASLGYPADDNRLVQRWAWYSLDDAEFEGAVTHHHLFDPQAHQIVQLGVDYGTYPDESAMFSSRIEVGWNSIALALDPLTSLTADDLCQKIADQGGAIAEVDRWYAGGWQGHICGLPFNNFAIDVGTGYFVKSTAVSTWTVGGFKISDPVPLDLEIGWNSVSIPHSGAYSAESLCDEITNQGVTALEIDRWYAGGWQGHICGLPFNDFAIEPGKGYFVKAGSAGQVTPAGE